MFVVLINGDRLYQNVCTDDVQLFKGHDDRLGHWDSRFPSRLSAVEALEIRLTDIRASLRMGADWDQMTIEIKLIP